MKKQVVFFILMVMLFGLTIVEAKPDYYDPIVERGRLEFFDDAYYVNGMELNFGDGRTIGADYDGDGVARPIKQELRSLIGKEIIVAGYRDRDPDEYDKMYVTQINGQFFPNPRVHR